MSQLITTIHNEIMAPATRNAFEQAQASRLAIERAERNGDPELAEAYRRHRANHAKANPDLYADRIVWRTA